MISDQVDRPASSLPPRHGVPERLPKLLGAWEGSPLYLFWPQGSRNCSGIKHDQGNAGIVNLRERDIQQRPIAQFELKPSSPSSVFQGLNGSAQKSKHLEVDPDRSG
jgi:hypothetical protein